MKARPLRHPPPSKEIYAAKTANADRTWQFYWKPEDAWSAMYRDCEQAQRSIDFEQYILQKDALGRHFLNLFSRKAKQVQVRVLCDAFGSWALYFSKWVRELRQSGVKLRFFNPIRLRGHYSILPRNHTKTMIVDSEVAYTGGVCFDQVMRDWRDTHIRLTGSVVGQMQRQFDHLWQERHRDDTPCLVPAEHGFTYVTANPFFGRNCIYDHLKHVIHHARDYVYLTSPFFIPSGKFMRLLGAATRRGVEVRLLVSAVSDVRFADFVGQSYLPEALRGGVRVYLYQPTVLHAKTAVADDVWATVGSMNLDHLSLFHNYESNVIITQPEAVRELKEHFLQNLNASVELLPERCQFPLWQRAIGRAGRLFKSVL